MASHASPNIFSIQSSRRLSAVSGRPHSGQLLILPMCRMKRWAEAMNVPWLQVRGDTKTGFPVTGWTCSASTPDGSAWSATQERSSAASASSSSQVAFITRWSTSQRVAMNQGLPGSPVLTRW